MRTRPKTALLESPIVLLGRHDPALPIALNATETVLESQLAVVQDLWGPENYSPLDEPFSSTALIAVPLTSGAIFGVVGSHLGARLRRYSEETGIWIDAFENNPPACRPQERKGVKVKFHKWTDNGNQLAENRFSLLFVFQAGEMSGPLPSIYSRCAKGLRKGGQLFVADLMRPGAVLDGKACSHKLRPPHDRCLRSLDDHKEALNAARLIVRKEYDLTEHVMAAIRHGLLGSTIMLTNVRKLENPWRIQRLSAFREQLETWLGLFQLLDLGVVSARGLLASKP